MKTPHNPLTSPAISPPKDSLVLSVMKPFVAYYPRFLHIPLGSVPCSCSTIWWHRGSCPAGQPSRGLPSALTLNARPLFRRPAVSPVPPFLLSSACAVASIL